MTRRMREIFVDDTVAMIRSNAAAIFGNLAVVFPVAMGVQWLANRILGANLITPAKAIATIDETFHEKQKEVMQV